MFKFFEANHVLGVSSSRVLKKDEWETGPVSKISFIWHLFECGLLVWAMVVVMVEVSPSRR